MIVLNQPFNHIDFRDSVIVSIQQNLHDKECRLTIELCNYGQSKHEQNDPEVILGILVFEDVHYFHVQPSHDLNLVPNKKEAEILDVVTTSNNDSTKSIKFTTQITEYAYQQHTIVAICIGFKNATWSIVDNNKLKS